MNRKGCVGGCSIDLERRGLDDNNHNQNDNDDNDNAGNDM